MIKNTDEALAALEAGKTGRKSTNVTGLYFNVKKDGGHWLARQRINGSDSFSEMGSVPAVTYSQAARVVDMINRPEHYAGMTLADAWPLYVDDHAEQWSASYLQRLEKRKKAFIQPLFFAERLRDLDQDRLNLLLDQCALLASREETKRVRGHVINVLSYFDRIIGNAVPTRENCPIPEPETPFASGAVPEIDLEILRLFRNGTAWFFDLVVLSILLERSPYELRTINQNQAEHWLVDERISETAKKHLSTLLAAAKFRKAETLFTAASSIDTPLPTSSVDNGFKKISQRAGVDLKGSQLVAAVKKQAGDNSMEMVYRQFLAGGSVNGSVNESVTEAP